MPTNNTGTGHTPLCFKTLACATCYLKEKLLMTSGKSEKQDKTQYVYCLTRKLRH